MLMIAGCSNTQPEEAPQSAIDPHLPEPESVHEPQLEDDMSEEDMLEGTRSVSEMGEEMYRLGQQSVILEMETEKAQKQALELYQVVVFMDCLERQTGGRVDGEKMERLVLRDSKEARACKAKISTMSPEEIAKAGERIVKEQKDEREPQD